MILCNKLHGKRTTKHFFVEDSLFLFGFVIQQTNGYFKENKTFNLQCHSHLIFPKIYQYSFIHLKGEGSGVTSDILKAALSFFINRQLNTDRHIIHGNLLISIAISQTVFMAGIEQTQNKVSFDKPGCSQDYFVFPSYRRKYRFLSSE